jgi:hypothetical protein
MAGASVAARGIAAGVAVLAVVGAAAPPARAFSIGWPAARAATAAAAAAVDVMAEVRADADWVLRARLPDGAIAWYPDRRFVSPYHGNYAAIGLAAATAATGDPRYVAAAWDWLSWYAAREDRRTGYVTNYRVDGAAETTTGAADSTDAYAGTFLVAVGAAWRASGDRARVAGLRRAVALAVRAIESTQDGDGLTWSKPAFRVKYLMDQAEAYAGLRSAAAVAGGLGERRLAARAAADADAMAAGVDRLWDSRARAYDWAVHANATRVRTSWSVLYQDAMEQAWAVGLGVATAARAGVVLRTLAARQPAWDEPGGGTGYWPVAGWAYLRAGRPAVAERAAGRIRAAAVASGRAWPVTTGVVGALLVLESRQLWLVGSGCAAQVWPAARAE